MMIVASTVAGKRDGDMMCQIPPACSLYLPFPPSLPFSPSLSPSPSPYFSLLPPVTLSLSSLFLFLALAVATLKFSPVHSSMSWPRLLLGLSLCLVSDDLLPKVSELHQVVLAIADAELNQVCLRFTHNNDRTFSASGRVSE